MAAKAQTFKAGQTINFATLGTITFLEDCQTRVETPLGIPVIEHGDFTDEVYINLRRNPKEKAESR